MAGGMGAIGKLMRRTRTNMISADVDRTAEEFWSRFGLRDGDYIEFVAGRGAKTRSVIGRILMIDDCYFNHGGGYTANVRVAPLLVGGRIGQSRRVALVVNANGGAVKTLWTNRPISRVRLGKDKTAHKASRV